MNYLVKFQTSEINQNWTKIITKRQGHLQGKEMKTKRLKKIKNIFGHGNCNEENQWLSFLHIPKNVSLLTTPLTCCLNSLLQTWFSVLGEYMALNTSTKRSSVVPGRRLSSPQNVLSFNLISQKIEYRVKTKWGKVYFKYKSSSRW